VRVRIEQRLQQRQQTRRCNLTHIVVYIYINDEPNFTANGYLYVLYNYIRIYTVVVYITYTN